ncbi:hypothetical protein LPB72_18905 [Hydrogenophaga crassostreae]|uniref:DUF5648 domain-containing protein n=1 Tax=Hydrogenophaga crassostreae TaxID=1763535 RepID=A0A167H3N9_9BURK|nr:hypothetical protein LPB072_09410 [Hydrogenophaga crassostreae]OAD40215.1 hypothetical protein LPB72_18905 [Hydrogenophaga crassostreae]
MSWALVACGGAGGEGAALSPAAAAPAMEAPWSQEATRKALVEGARLNAQELAEEQATTGFSAQTKAVATVPVYRFYNRDTGAHFYTVSSSERDAVRATLANMLYEGAAFEAGAQAATGLSPVYRFLNRLTGVHFYTISETERDHIQATLAQFNYEGVAYFASKVTGAGLRPLSRFFLAGKGFHFYSVNPSEVALLPQYAPEGVAYFVIGEAPSTPGRVRSYGHCAGADLGVGAALNGCIPFPADNAWNQDVSALPRDPDSDTLIASIGLSTGLHPDFGAGLYAGAPIGIPYVVVSGSQPRVNIAWTAYGDESDPGPYPVPTGAPIEGGPNSTGDRHVLVIDRDNNRLYELGRAFPASGGNWNANVGAVFHIDSNLVRPGGQPGWTSADAAGLPIFPGLARYDEAALGPGGIAHALRFTVQRSRKAYVPPATHWASANTSANLPPMGMRVRLKASYVIPATFSTETRALLTAMKTHGMMVADNGSNWYVSGAPDPRWNNDTLNRELGQVLGRDFEVVRMDGMVQP